MQIPGCGLLGLAQSPSASPENPRAVSHDEGMIAISGS